MDKILLKNLKVKNFRIFKNFAISKFSQVNLIVGKNNTGKSCLLEAIGVYNSKGDPKFLSQIIDYRSEIWSTKEAPFENIFEHHPIRHLFYGHKITHLNEPGIEIGPLNSPNKVLKIRPRAFKVLQNDAGEYLRKPLDQKELFANDLIEYELFLEMEQGKIVKWGFQLDQDIRRSFRRFQSSFFRRKSEYENINTSQFVPANGLSGDEVTTLWDSIALTELEHNVVESLRIIEEKVQDIALVRDKISASRDDSRIPILKLENSAERISLKSMGDGMTRIFDIILSLVNSKDGVLLIDEFENGLHWSIHTKVWFLIFKLAKSLNVQVFVTTHSKDGVDGYFKAWKDHKESGSFHRLEKSEDPEVITPFSYDYETLQDALKTNTEVR